MIEVLHKYGRALATMMLLGIYVCHTTGARAALTCGAIKQIQETAKSTTLTATPASGAKRLSYQWARGDASTAGFDQATPLSNGHGIKGAQLLVLTDASPTFAGSVGVAFSYWLRVTDQTSNATADYPVAYSWIAPTDAAGRQTRELWRPQQMPFPWTTDTTLLTPSFAQMQTESGSGSQSSAQAGFAPVLGKWMLTAEQVVQPPCNTLENAFPFNPTYVTSEQMPFDPPGNPSGITATTHARGGSINVPPQGLFAADEFTLEFQVRWQVNQSTLIGTLNVGGFNPQVLNGRIALQVTNKQVRAVFAHSQVVGSPWTYSAVLSFTLGTPFKAGQFCALGLILQGTTLQLTLDGQPVASATHVIPWQIISADPHQSGFFINGDARNENTQIAVTSRVTYTARAIAPAITIIRPSTITVLPGQGETIQYGRLAGQTRTIRKRLIGATGKFYGPNILSNHGTGVIGSLRIPSVPPATPISATPQAGYVQGITQTWWYDPRIVARSANYFAQFTDEFNISLCNIVQALNGSQLPPYSTSNGDRINYDVDGSAGDVLPIDAGFTPTDWGNICADMLGFFINDYGLNVTVVDMWNEPFGNETQVTPAQYTAAWNGMTQVVQQMQQLGKLPPGLLLAAPTNAWPPELSGANSDTIQVMQQTGCKYLMYHSYDTSLAEPCESRLFIEQVLGPGIDVGINESGQSGYVNFGASYPFGSNKPQTAYDAQKSSWYALEMLQIIQQAQQWDVDGRWQYMQSLASRSYGNSTFFRRDGTATPLWHCFVLWSKMAGLREVQATVSGHPGLQATAAVDESGVVYVLVTCNCWRKFNPQNVTLALNPGYNNARTTCYVVNDQLSNAMESGGADTLQTLAVAPPDATGSLTVTMRLNEARLFVIDPQQRVTPSSSYAFTPTGFTAQTVYRQNLLRWAANVDTQFDHYVLRRNGLSIYSGPAGQYTDMGMQGEGLAPDSTNIYTLAAVDQSGTESPPTSLRVMTTSTLNPSPPAQVQGISGIANGGSSGIANSGSIELYWLPNQEADLHHYKVTCANTGATYVVMAPTTSLHITTGLSLPTNSFFVQAVNTSGQLSNASAAISYSGFTQSFLPKRFFVTLPDGAAHTVDYVPPTCSLNAHVKGSRVVLTWTAASSLTSIDHVVLARNGVPIYSGHRANFTDTPGSGVWTYTLTAYQADYEGGLMAAAQQDVTVN